MVSKQRDRRQRRILIATLVAVEAGRERRDDVWIDGVPPALHPTVLRDVAMSGIVATRCRAGEIYY